MKNRWILVGSIVAVLLLALAAGLTLAQGPEGGVGPQGGGPPDPYTTFTYQGLLKRNGAPVNNTCDFRLDLYDDIVGGSLIARTFVWAPVTDGLFTIPVPFGEGAFTGKARWLEIAVKCSGDADYVTLTPRQPLYPAPYAMALPGFRTVHNDTSPNVIGGYHGNIVADGVVGATIAGGGNPEDEGSPAPNRVTDNYGTVGGGYGNQAGDGSGTTDDAPSATVGGGRTNTASGNDATVGGGYVNTASGNAATVGGGGLNTASGYAATVGGGHSNEASGDNATVGGGYRNEASGNYTALGGGSLNTASGSYATVPGGRYNTASGGYSFAAGRRAKANHDGAFVWADSTDADFASDRDNQFKVRASGGVYFVVSSTGLNPPGVMIEQTSNNGVGLFVSQQSSDAGLVVTNSGSGPLIKAFSSGGNLRFQVTNSGDVRADGQFISGGADFAEMLPAGEEVQPGDVLVVGTDGKLYRSRHAYATAVVGVYSTRPGFVGGQGAEVLNEGRVPVAVVGVVPVKASAENGPIRPGDLLVTSSTPGYAMKADPNPPVGTVIGKALEGLDEGTGVIRMLVMLR